MRYAQDPVYMQPDGQWCFYNTTLDGFYGPFPGQDTARSKLGEYLAWLNEQPATVPVGSDVEKTTGEFLRLRAEKATINERFKVELDTVQTKIDKAEVWLLSYLNTTGLKNFSVDDATVYTDTQTQASIGDKGLFMQYVREQRLPELLQARVSSTALKEFLDSGHPLPPGLSVNVERVVRVRRK
jgi:hypothetical protein